MSYDDMPSEPVPTPWSVVVILVAFGATVCALGWQAGRVFGWW